MKLKLDDVIDFGVDIANPDKKMKMCEHLKDLILLIGRQRH